jgi:hypothetical protein
MTGSEPRLKPRTSCTESDTLSDAARCRTLYGKFAEFVVDPEAPASQTRGIKYQIDDSYLEP